MRTIHIGNTNTNKMTDALQKALAALAKGGLKKLYNHIDQKTIKQGVDEMGIDKFINQCALLAAGSGAATGAGGIATMLVGAPLDMVNLVMQQFRVTMAIRYHATGQYKVNFIDLIKLVGASLKVDAGVAVTKNIMEEIVSKLLLAFGGKAVRRLVPVIGAVIGGTANYLFIKRVASNLQAEKIMV